MDVIVVGGGKVGSYLASILLAEGHCTRIIEADSKEISRLKEEFSPDSLFSGSGSDPAVLEAAGIRNAGVVAAVTGIDEVNLVVTCLSRFEFRVPRTIARVKNPKNAWMFTPVMGVDVAVNQADLISRLIVEEMSLGNMMTLLKLQKGQYSLVEEKVHPFAPAAGKAVKDLCLPSECILAAVIRGGKLIIPHGDTVIEASDEVLAVVHALQMDRLASILGRADGSG